MLALITVMLYVSALFTHHCIALVKSISFPSPVESVIILTAIIFESGAIPLMFPFAVIIPET